ncbi:MAG: type II secretion system F family protein [Ruminococcaceae bacterium]|nr:type II secretion system F family protein [Oscillospiraceae bacterium]
MRTKTYLRSEEIEWICRELALLLHAGVSVADGLYLMAAEEQGSALGPVLSELGRMTDEGATLSQAAEQTGCFPHSVSALFAVGQMTGHLEEVLSGLSEQYRQQARMTAAVRSALLYPAALGLVMLAVLLLLLVKVLPLFEKTYASLGGQMTGLAGGLSRIGGMLDRSLPVVLLFLILLLLGAGVFLMVPAWRQKLSRFWQRRRGHRGLSWKQNQARLAMGLALGLRAGMTEEEALYLGKEILGDCAGAQERCGICSALLLQGQPLTSALEQAELLPVRECRILALARKSGAFDRAMEETALRLEEQSANALRRRMGLVEPVMVIVLSLLTGGILLSVMLPLMQILSALG